jgi:ABC-type nitrate/sulfonate/bicarbonate transport system substrate-binding protein
VLADLADTKIEYPFLSLNMMGSYIDRNLRLAKALIRSMSESVRALQTDPANAKIAIRAALKTDDAETIDYALRRSVQVLDRRPFPTQAGIQTVIDELGKEAKGKNLKFDDYVDMRALRELEKEGFFK